MISTLDIHVYEMPLSPIFWLAFVGLKLIFNVLFNSLAMAL